VDPFAATVSSKNVPTNRSTPAPPPLSLRHLPKLKTQPKEKGKNMTDPIKLSDRALKILVILWRAAAPITRTQIMADYARPISNRGLQIALTELENARLVSRIGYRDGWQATPNSVQLILCEVSQRETSPLASSSSSFQLEENKNNRELLLARPNEVSQRETSYPHVDNSVDNPLFAKNLESCQQHGIQEPKASQIAVLAHVTPDYITAHVESGIDLPLAIWRITNKFPAPKPKRESQKDRDAYLAYLVD